eukprot:UC4_evm5s1242
MAIVSAPPPHPMSRRSTVAIFQDPPSKKIPTRRHKLDKNIKASTQSGLSRRSSKATSDPADNNKETALAAANSKRTRRSDPDPVTSASFEVLPSTRGEKQNQEPPLSSSTLAGKRPKRKRSSVSSSCSTSASNTNGKRSRFPETEQTKGDFAGADGTSAQASHNLNTTNSKVMTAPGNQVHGNPVLHPEAKNLTRLPQDPSQAKSGSAMDQIFREPLPPKLTPSDENREYAEDIHKYMRNRETEFIIPFEFKGQGTNHRMRSILVDWLIEVQVNFKLCAETLYLSISILDRFLVVKAIKRDKLQLASAVAMLIASKHEEIYPPEVEDFVYICADTYTKQEVLNMEREILHSLNFKLAAPLSLHFLGRYAQASDLLLEQLYMAHFLLELTLQEPLYRRFEGSLVAAAAFDLACKVYGTPGWTEDMQNIFHLETENVVKVAKEICVLVTNNLISAFELCSFGDMESEDDHGKETSPEEQEAQAPSIWMILQQSVFNFLIVWCVMHFAKPGNRSTSATDKSSAGIALTTPAWDKGTNLEAFAYVSESLNFAIPENDKVRKMAIWSSPFVFDMEEQKPIYHNLRLDIPPAVAANETDNWYMHFYFRKLNSESSDPLDHRYMYAPLNFVSTRPLIKKRKQTRTPEKKNLAKSFSASQASIDNSETFATEQPELLRQYIHPNVTVNFVTDFNRYSKSTLPQQMLEHMIFDEASNTYLPTIYHNDFWAFKDEYIEINETTDHIDLQIQLDCISMWKFQFLSSMEASFARPSITGEEQDPEIVKSIFKDTSPIFLTVTLVVSILHTFCDFLAFKNDITFWRERKTVEGLSIKSIFVSILSQLIIFLYLLDKETTYMILISSGISIIIECWKLTRAAVVSIVYLHGFMPIISVKDREEYKESDTKKYDDMAMTYLGLAAIPLLSCYAVYSFMYEEHAGLWSYIIGNIHIDSPCNKGTLAGGVYTFGFIMMTPQLFINYKLKSVAHLPWRMMTYKALNTVIIFCTWKRWIYPTDKTRVNEFGYTGELASDKDKEKGPGAENVIDRKKKN